MSNETRKFPVSGFICVSPEITKTIDIYASIIFGYIWNKCGLAEHKCTTSYATMAEELGLSKKTIERKIALLIECDLINDVSGTKYNTPGVTRKYVCNESKLISLKRNINKKSSDCETLVSNDYETLVTDTSDYESITSDSQSQSNVYQSQSSVSQSKSSVSESVKIDKEIDKEIERKIEKEIEENSEILNNLSKEEKPKLQFPSALEHLKQEQEENVWYQAISKKYDSSLESYFLECLANELNNLNLSVDTYAWVLNLLPEDQMNFHDFDVNLILDEIKNYSPIVEVEEDNGLPF